MRRVNAVVLVGRLLVVVLGVRRLRGHLTTRRSRVGNWRRLKVVVVVLKVARSLQMTSMARGDRSAA